jgi:beta-lactamase regulating signal transducer with metallopeptidase domain
MPLVCSLMHRSDAVFAGLAGLPGASHVGGKWASVKWANAAFAQFAHAAAPAAAAALWQGALIALALLLCLRFALRVSAAHRFAVWAAGFAVAALLPLLALLEHSGSAAAPLGAVAARPWLQLDSRWGFAIAALWLAASTARTAELGFHLLRLRRLRQAATPVEADGRLRSLLAVAMPERRVEICTTRDLDRPNVIGFFAPRILIPDWLYARLTPGELEQVVLHEAEHLRRRDDWTNLLQKLSLVVFPLNPALAWMERRLCREREMACDEGVVQRTQAPRTYAACLASIAERGLQRREFERREFLRRAQALSLGVFDRRPELVHRVDSILRRRRALHPLAAGALVGVMACGLGLGAFELSRSPQLVAFVAATRPHGEAPDEQAAVLALRGAEIQGSTRAPGVVRVSYARTSKTYSRTSKPGPAADDLVFRPSRPFRAIETAAILPTIRSAAVTPFAARTLRRDSDDSSPGVTKTAMTDADAVPREVRVNAEAPTPAELAAQDQETQSQEFIVLTAWEEVVTSAPQASASTTRTIADYDTGADTQAQSDAATGGPGAAEITVTRLILLVYRASAGPTSGLPGAQRASATGSHSHQPAAPYSGWLFFQL